ncbi:cdc42-like [Tropilaelaps mercedesae]|uniref:Cdc42-like n=1 Tax=Tropilaelaps mercedesae TaxID=418985 RepID=A0A1V9Y0G7_9ACAR|nr:cdc42-like [Tropilaelaps mercedesae]
MLPRRNDSRAPDIKCVLLGDSQVGKTALLYSYATSIFEHEVPRTCMNSYEITVRVREKELTLGIFDTAGEEKLKGLRRFAYPSTDIFVICFSVEDRASFSHVERWVNDLKVWGPESPFILVGTKKDLRDRGNIACTRNEIHSPRCVNHVEGQRLARQVHAVAYIETSACTMVQETHYCSNYYY